MSKDSDRDTLIDLFSTRSRGTATTSIEYTGNSRPPTSGVGKSSGGRSSSSGGTTTSSMRSSLSPIANTILREARRELGSDVEEEAEGQVSEDRIARAIDKVCSEKGHVIDDMTRAEIIVHLKKDLLGWGILQPLIDNAEVTDIHCYDYSTVVLQRGKLSETTGLRWPSPESYKSFVDRVLMRLGKSISTQQHTVDASFPDGKRLCAVHESVCGQRGPFLTIRVPRIADVSLESLVSYQVAPPLIVNYLAALIRTCEHTFMVAGETGTGKTTLMRCLGTQFRADESIIGVEDTPELNYQHPYYRSLVSRASNTEGVGEVTLQEHIKTTLRLCPSRVILGEMRSPEAAEAFLEAAQTGHSGMSTIHARNAKETLTRLESLLGRAQRGVNVEIIRQQIALAVDVVIWMTRERGSGKVRLAEVIEVGHFVEGAIQIRPMFKLKEEGDSPKWKIQSYASNFEEVLEKNGIFLGDAPEYVGFSSMGSHSSSTEASGSR